MTNDKSNQPAGGPTQEPSESSLPHVTPGMHLPDDTHPHPITYSCPSCGELAFRIWRFDKGYSLTCTYCYGFSAWHQTTQALHDAIYSCYDRRSF